MDKGKHPKRYPQGSMASLNWKQLQGFMREDRRNSRQSRAHRLEALQETASVGRAALTGNEAIAREEADAASLLQACEGIISAWLHGDRTARQALRDVQEIVIH